MTKAEKIVRMEEIVATATMLALAGQENGFDAAKTLGAFTQKQAERIEQIMGEDVDGTQNSDAK